MLERVDFDRHVASLFGRLGCNAGSCHGSFQGRGGLNLSLFGHDPARDYATLTRNVLGRRVDVMNPDRSLLLLKPTGLVPHEGGLRFKAGSWEYRVIRAWIAEGASRDPSRGAVERIEIRPAALSLQRPGSSGRLSVVARFAAGDEEDVTPFCDLRVRDDAIAEAAPGGEVRGLRPGDTAVVASYNGRLAAARVSVPTGRVVTVPDVPECDVIDREVFAKLAAWASHRPGRRPTPSSSVGSRSTSSARCPLRKMSAPSSATPVRTSGRGRSMSCSRTRCTPRSGPRATSTSPAATSWRWRGRTTLRPRRAQMWHDWFRKRFAENTPYSEIARGVITATQPGRIEADAWADREAARMIALKNGSASDYASKPGLDLYWRRFANGEYVAVEPLAERTAAAFLGMRVECAQCHKHPFDRWTQADYRAFANVFAKVQFGLSPEGLAATARLLEQRRKSDPNGTLAPIPRLSETYLSERPVAASGRPRDRPPARTPGARRPGIARARRPARGALRLADGARQPVLRPQLRQPRLGRLFRSRAGRPRRWFLDRQPALERAAARRAGGRLRHPRL